MAFQETTCECGQILGECMKYDTFHYKTLIFVNFCMSRYTRSLWVSGILKGLPITFLTCIVNWVSLKTVSVK